MTLAPPSPGEIESRSADDEPDTPARPTTLGSQIETLFHRLGRSPRMVVSLLCGIHAVLLLALISPVDAPTVYPDEFGYIAIGREISGNYPDSQFVDVAYQFGYGLLLAPLARMFGEPYDFHAAAQILNVVLAVAVIPLLWQLSRRLFGASTSEAAVATMIGALAPALLVQPALLWAETALALATVICVLALWWLVDKPRWWRAVVLGIAAGWAYAVHPRAFGLIAALLVTVIWVGARRTIPRRWAGLAVISTGGAFMVVRQIQKAVAERVFNSASLPLDADNELDLLLSSAIPNADRWLRGLVGALWYQGLITLGLALVAAAWALRIIVARWRRPDAEWAVALAVSLAWGAALLIGALVFLAEERRIDHAVYGRYAGHLLPVVLTVGSMVLMRERVRAAALLRWAVVLVGLGAILTRFAHPQGFWTGEYAIPNTPAFGMVGETLMGAEPLRVGLAVAVLVFAFAWITQRWGPAGLLVLGGFLLAVGWWATVARIDPRSEWSERNFGFVSTFPVDNFDDPVVLGEDIDVFIARYGMQYWSPRTVFVLEENAPDSARMWMTGAERGAPTDDSRLAEGDDTFALRTWLRPGPRADVLAWSGSLFWDGIEEERALPDQAAFAELVSTVDEPLELRGGATVDVPLWVRHAGEEYPWPHNMTLAGEESVRLGARWYRDGIDYVGENRTGLKTSLRPGDVVFNPIRLSPIDFDLEPLPPGRYTVEIDVMQEFHRWFGAEGRAAPVVIEVVVP